MEQFKPKLTYSTTNIIHLRLLCVVYEDIQITINANTYAGRLGYKLLSMQNCFVLLTQSRHNAPKPDFF